MPGPLVRVGTDLVLATIPWRQREMVLGLVSHHLPDSDRSSHNLGDID